ncbi:methionine aminotransferase [Brumimicrobium mesophilum]|uniref:methionine aminotransferase n=1 Tax=Brumimicrobium mesophilum TaxID=392717 RepID=UPI000D141DE6|nr:methionine aminotransferase [Brumimicrobium mesophilum]
MSKIKSKLPHVGTTIFSVMSKMAAEHNAINLSQGFPNFPVAPELVENYKKVIEGEYHQYMPMPGSPRLLVEISEKVSKHYGRNVNPEEEVLVTSGATQAIYTVIQAIIHREDEAIVLDPSYDCYAPSVELAGGKPIHVNMEADFSVDWNKVEDAISAKTKLLIINNPHNPGGTVFSEADMQAIELIMERNPHVYLLSDEVYEFIHFEQKHISVNTRKAIRERSFIVSSFGKTFHVTGWKIGYLVAPKFLMEEVKKIHQYVVFCVNSTAQQTLSNYLPQADLSQLGEFYQKKRDFFRGLMKNSRFELLDCQGTYFQVARYNEISNLGDVDFATEMTQKHGVAVIPVSGFNKDQHDDHLIRFCFAKDEETIIKATEKLCKI